LKVIRGTTTVKTIDYTLDKKDGNFMRGRFLRLVSDASDDAAPSVGTTPDPHDQTILVRLGDKIKVSHAVSGGGKVEQEIQVGRPSSENNNEADKPRKHDIREVKVRIVAVKDENGNSCVTDATVDEFVATANERFAQAGIRLKRSQDTVEVIEPPSKPADSVGPAYTYDQEYQYGTIDPVARRLTSPSEDEIAFSLSKDADQNTIDIFFIKRFKSSVPVRALSYYSALNATGNSAISNFVVISSERVQVFTMPNEIMHVLLNRDHRDFEPFDSLFYSPTSEVNMVMGTKRIGPFPQAEIYNVGNDDATVMRSTAETLP
jgi:hypothetical protein